MSYKATVVDHGFYMEIKLTKYRLIFTRAQFDEAQARGKAWSRNEATESRAATRRAQHEAKSLDWVE